jgi:hypothetical protein
MAQSESRFSHRLRRKLDIYASKNKRVKACRDGALACRFKGGGSIVSIAQLISESSKLWKNYGMIYLGGMWKTVSPP